jgi:hypothetical protein
VVSTVVVDGLELGRLVVMGEKFTVKAGRA